MQYTILISNFTSTYRLMIIVSILNTANMRPGDAGWKVIHRLARTLFPHLYKLPEDQSITSISCPEGADSIVITISVAGKGETATFSSAFHICCHGKEIVDQEIEDYRDLEEAIKKAKEQLNPGILA